MIICESCGKEFSADNVELHEIEQTQVSLGCPYCSYEHVYLRNEGD